jgi:hypothetical protein
MANTLHFIQEQQVFLRRLLVLGPRHTIQSIIPKLLNPSFGLRVLLRMIVRNKQRKGSAPCELAEKKSLKIVST